MRRTLLSLVLVVAFALLAVSVAREVVRPPAVSPHTGTLPTLTAVGHRTYSLSLLAPLQDSVWHPGETKVFRWVPQFTGFSQAARPDQVVCRVAFYGPYPSPEAAGQVLQASSPPSFGGTKGALPSPAFAPTTLTLNDWMEQPTAVAVTLPSTLLPGYYIVEGHTAAPTEEGASANIVQVASI